jgi:hypothetical protein
MAPPETVRCSWFDMPEQPARDRDATSRTLAITRFMEKLLLKFHDPREVPP